MSHQHTGHYAAKHPPETTLNPLIADQIKQCSANGRISCGDAHAIARQLHVSPAEVGIAIDLLEIRISSCLLGLFGNGRNTKPVQSAANNISSELQDAILQLQQNKRLSCLAAWELAEKLGVSKLEVASACEKLHLKISECQLGTF